VHDIPRRPSTGPANRRIRPCRTLTGTQAWGGGPAGARTVRLRSDSCGKAHEARFRTAYLGADVLGERVRTVGWAVLVQGAADPFDVGVGCASGSVEHGGDAAAATKASRPSTNIGGQAWRVMPRRPLDGRWGGGGSPSGGGEGACARLREFRGRRGPSCPGKLTRDATATADADRAQVLGITGTRPSPSGPPLWRPGRAGSLTRDTDGRRRNDSHKRCSRIDLAPNCT